MMKLKFVLLLSSVLFITAPVVIPSTLLVTPSHIHNVHTLQTTADNWAGYVVETNFTTPQNGAITDVKGSWIVPSVSVNKTPIIGYSSCWVGISNSSTLEQIGIDSKVINGRAVYSVWYEMIPGRDVFLKMKVNAGDTISAEVSYLRQNSFRLSITDVTTGVNFSTIQKSKAFTTNRSSAEWIIERPFFIIEFLLGWHLADFGTVYFFNSQVTCNGVTGTINNAHWQNEAITMQRPLRSPPINIAQPSPLSTDGTSFSVAWLHK